jgi:hypothetical protein
MKSQMKRIAAVFLLLVTAAGIASAPADAKRLRRYPMLGQNYLIPTPPDAVDFAQNMDGAQDYADPGAGGDLAIRPREAASIARQVVPGAKVLNVRLLPSGVYAVTLRGDGKLTRVMVDGRSGDIL